MPSSHQNNIAVSPKADDPDSTAPAWFLGLQQKTVGHFDRVVDRILDRLDIIVKIQLKHEEAIAQSARDIAELSRCLSGELTNLKNRQMANEHTLASLQERSATTEETSTTAPVLASTVTEDCHDDCEVRLSGLPVILDPCDITNVKHVLKALGEERLLPHSRLLRGHTLLASPPELDIFFRTRCLVPSCECGSRFCRRWQVPNLLCRLHLVSVVLASGATL
ncbi:unnamed protein product [Trichogramma brassicae]|uniref:Uncharacterized protein n=1 Tax=Trichogramma brassicae TaxID=86971 RepID=A0A6H5I6S3_9HYME|nr:unnamed protein product [Trichogramma brassicae]